MLASDLYDNAVDGTKLATCRTNHRDLSCGELTLKNVDTGESIIVNAHTVKWTTFNRLTEEDILEEADSHIELYDSMLRFYPDFKWTDPVTFIAWEAPRTE
jgi:hypothetical protein